MDKVVEPPCFRCRHLLVYPFCTAFQGDIPDEIREGKNNHFEPFPGDHGVQFEPIEANKEGDAKGLKDAPPTT